ncbi:MULTISPECIES: acyl carrier protein [Clostridia]|jgi:acyl carrier protein|uniref:acyl carrier protein n=1 Tax=Clostridia TaxID=186801 RepID=UPI001A9BF0E9|nr:MULTISPECIES: phosphopantetheine-binding protein [Clostridiaceae]MDO5793675.1 phosphopantetheine-binding protein [Turicibacter sp.]
MIFEKVKEILDEYIEVNVEDITLQTRLIEDLGINSYEFMSIIGEIEEEFDFEVDEKSVLKLITIEDLLDYISNFTKENVLV